MKRVFPILLSFILVFNISAVSVFASSGSSDWPAPFDYAIQSGENSIEFVKRVGTAFLNGVADPTVRQRLKVIDTLCGSTGCGIAYMMHLKNSGSSYSDACDTVINDVTQDNNGVWVADNGTATFISNYYNNTNNVQNGTGESLSNLLYINGYMVSNRYLLPSAFNYREEYLFCSNTIAKNPDLYWYIRYDSSLSKTYMIGSKISPTAAVLARDYWDNTKYTVSLYNDNWSTNFSTDINDEKCALSIYFSSVSDELVVQYVNSSDQFQTIPDVDYTGMVVDDELFTTANPSAGNFSTMTLYFDPSTLQDEFNQGIAPTIPSSGASYLWHGSGSTLQAIPVFNTLVDLKNGTLNKPTVQTLPSYTVNGPNMSGVTAQQVQQADEIINNYYSPNSNDPGGGSGNGNGNGDNNGGSGIWDTLANAINGLLTVLGGLISGLVSGLTEVLTSLGGFFTGVLDLANNGVLGLFQAFFPFVPEEWFTVVGLAIGVAFLVFIIKVFKG